MRDALRAWSRLDAWAAFVDGQPPHDALARLVGEHRARARVVGEHQVQPLVELCRLKLEELALCGDLDLAQLQRVAPYLELLPPALVRRFMHSLLVKSLTGLFPLSLAGRLHLVFPYAVLRHCPLVCRVDHWAGGFIQFDIPESTDGYFCSACLAIACGECLSACQACQALVCKNCGTFTANGKVPKLTEQEWERAGKPVPLEFRSIDMWTCAGQCEPQRTFSWALKAQEEWEHKTWANASEYAACVHCYRSLEDRYGSTMLREDMNRLEAQMFSECQECCELACTGRCETSCEECHRATCRNCSYEVTPCQRCLREAVCEHCLYPLEDETVVCWSCYKETLDCKKRVAAMVAWLDPESLSPAVRDRLAAGIAQHGGRVVCRPPPPDGDAGQQDPAVTHIISANPWPRARGPPERPTPVLRPETVLAWLACLTTATAKQRC